MPHNAEWRDYKIIATGDGEKLEQGLYELVEMTRQPFSEKPLFYLIKSYTTGFQPTVLKNVLGSVLKGIKGVCEAYELTLPTEEEGIELPCGASSMFIKD